MRWTKNLFLTGALVFALAVTVSADEGDVDDAAFPWGGDGEGALVAPVPNVDDLSAEGKEGRGVASMMMSSGMGHMVGTTAQTSSNVGGVVGSGGNSNVEVERALSADMRAKDERISELTEEVNKLKAEEERLKVDLQSVKSKAESKKKEIDGKLDAAKQKLLDEESKKMTKVKQEAALKVKKVRVEKEKQLSMEKDEMNAQIAAAQRDYDSAKADMEARLQTAKDSAHAADMQAEEIFKEQRAQWRAKHQRELEARGVKNEVDHIHDDNQALSREYDELEKRKIEAKQHMRKVVEEKLVMAAKLKNLHAREEDLEEKQRQMSSSNERLRHEIDEVQLTQSENSAAVEMDVQKALKTKASVIESAKAEAQISEENFKATTLKKAQDEIDQLRKELSRRAQRDEKRGGELLEQERRVQAELKESEDAMAKAKYDVQLADEQVKIELAKARDESIAVVDEARVKAAALKEHARAKGMRESKEEVAKIVAEQKEREEDIKREQDSVGKLAIEFEEKTARQIQEREAKMKADIDKKRHTMEKELQSESAAKVAEFRRKEESKIANLDRVNAAAIARIEKAEGRIKELTKQHASLKKQIKVAKANLAKDKADWTYKQTMNPMAQMGLIPQAPPLGYFPGANK